MSINACIVCKLFKCAIPASVQELSIQLVFSGIKKVVAFWRRGASISLARIPDDYNTHTTGAYQSRQNLNVAISSTDRESVREEKRSWVGNTTNWGNLRYGHASLLLPNDGTSPSFQHLPCPWLSQSALLRYFRSVCTESKRLSFFSEHRKPSGSWLSLHRVSVPLPTRTICATLM